MATTTGKPSSSSGQIRRLIGIHQGTLQRRVAALLETIRQTTGASEEEIGESLSDAQVEYIRSLSDEDLLANIDFLSDVLEEVKEAHAKLKNRHEEFLEICRLSDEERAIRDLYISKYGDYTTSMETSSEMIKLAQMILKTYEEITKERNIDWTPVLLDELSSDVSTHKSIIVKPSSPSNSPPTPRPRSSIPSSTDKLIHELISPQIHPSKESIHPHPSIHPNPSIHPHPSNDPSIHPSHPYFHHPPGFYPYPYHPSYCLRDPSLPIDPSIPPPPGFVIPTLYQQSAMAGRVEPPTFNGDITTFSEFKESFESLFGSLDDLTKLGMLISCLGPEPKRLISGLRRIDRNFKTAMIILTKEYDKAPLVRHALLSRIRTLQPCDEEGIRLREIYLTLCEVIHHLLPEDSDDTSEILSNMVLSKLPPSQPPAPTPPRIPAAIPPKSTKHHPPKPGDRPPTQHITSMAIHDPDPVFNAFLRYGDTFRDGRDDHFL